MHPLILASQSPSRKALLERFQIPFSVLVSNIDETQQAKESPEKLVTRLSFEKAGVQAEKYPEHTIIGSDIVAVKDNTVYGKPNHHEGAVEILMQFSGQKIDFLCGVCLLKNSVQQKLTHIETFSIWYRKFNETQVNAYLKKEQPFHCAGALMFEGLGIALIEKSEGNDPSSILGLPLMWLAKYLPKFGIEVL